MGPDSWRRALEAHRERMGWRLPWLASLASDCDEALGPRPTAWGSALPASSGATATKPTASATPRCGGVEQLGGRWTYVDLAPFGRQEVWDDSPAGWPRTPPHDWVRRHDAYEPAS